MKVELLVSRATDEQVYRRGDVIEVEADEGLRLIKAGQARRLEPETAAIAPAERAVRKRGRPRKLHRPDG